MDKKSLVLKLNKAVPGAVLETLRFGRSGSTTIWVEAQAIQKIAMAIKLDPVFQLDWLENLSIVEFENVFVVTYFVGSTVTSHSLVIRASAVPSAPDAEIQFPSVRSIWSMATPMEEDAGEMFGIVFGPSSETEKGEKATRLPENWQGYPLRKNYSFPKTFLGIPHSPPLFNGSSQKKPVS